MDAPLSRDFYNTIARYYDAENEDMTDDLDVYSELAEQTGAPILDVGCGTGRVLLHLALQGHRVAGIDTSAAMLDRARRKLNNRVDLEGLVMLYEGNVLDHPLPEQYPLILIPYNGLMHFRTTADQLALLRHMADCLTPDGLLVIDLPNAGETFATVDDSAVTLDRTFFDRASGPFVILQYLHTLTPTY